MLKNLIILSNGTEIYSGNARDNAIISCTYTQCVNDGTELSIGSACCNELELKLFLDKAISISAGDEIAYYKVADDGIRTKIGIFRCEKPTVTGNGTYKFVAYDRVSLLDKDLTEWLVSLNGWPYTVSKFAEMICAACGLTLAAVPAVNANYQIREFSGAGVTGRMLMQWLGQIACCFIRANAEGKIEFAWYANNDVEIATKGEFAYFGGGLSYEDYQVAEIEKVQIQASESDNGTVYPDGNEEELNTYKITGNYLLTAETGDELKPVAQAIYEQLQGVAYTPCKVSIQATATINAGDIVTITDGNNNKITVYVMSKTNKGQKDTLECTGNYKRDSSTATNEISLKALNGKVLNISKSVDGLRIENKDTAGKLAKLELDVDGIETRVENAEGDISKIEQTAGEVHVTAQKKKILGPAYSFDVVDGNLVLTYSGEQPGYSINDKGELVLEYEGDTPPDTWIDENGVLHSADDSAMITEHIGTLTSVIDGDGTWKTEFKQNGKVVSSIYFDFEKRRFVFDGDIVVGDNLKGDITEITNEAIRTTNVVAENLTVKAANIDEKLTANQIETEGLHVKAENVDNLQIGGRNLLRGTRDLSGFRVNSWGGIFSGNDGFSYVRFISGDRDDGEYKWVISDKKTIPMESILGKEVTISFELRDDSPWTATGSMIQLELSGCNGEKTNRLRYEIVNVATDVSFEWERISLKFTITEDFFTGTSDNYSGDFSEITRFWLRLYCNNDAQRLEVRKFKLELGNVATDWSAAVEDGEEALEEVKDDVSELKVTAKGVDMVSENSNGKLVSFIGNGDDGGEWSAKYYNSGGEYKSGLYFDFDEGKFVFDGKIVATSGKIGDWEILSDFVFTMDNGTYRSTTAWMASSTYNNGYNNIEQTVFFTPLGVAISTYNEDTGEGEGTVYRTWDRLLKNT